MQLILDFGLERLVLVIVAGSIASSEAVSPAVGTLGGPLPRGFRMGQPWLGRPSAARFLVDAFQDTFLLETQKMLWLHLLRFMNFEPLCVS